MNVDHSEKLTHISLCTGYGGIDLGLKRAIGSVSTVCYVEIEAFVIENLVAKIEAEIIDPAPIFTNLKTFPWEHFSGRVDILSGGFPCQPFSAAGRRGGDEDPRHLWPYIVDGIKRLGRPPIVFFENVEGILSSKLKGDQWSDPEGTPVLLHVHRELERLGYRATSSVFSAAEVGATHRRKRVFILGVRNDLSDKGREWITQSMGNTKGEQNRFRELGEVEEESRERSSQHNATRFTSGGFRTAYPAPRGAEQYPYEPPRTQLGNSQHDGSPIPEKCGNPNETGHNCQKGPQISIESERAGRSEVYANIQGNELGNPHVKGLEGGVLRGGSDLKSKMGCTITRSSKRESENVDNPDQSRLLRDRNETTNTESERREDSLRHDAETDSSSRGVQGEIESEVGGNVDGFTHWMDYAELYESCDSRIDELRMLGNGVVPDTAKRAFTVLWQILRRGRY
tara:strand:+ start:9265 stop:10629 length:1365 start_codon:yes stop_codon:yes gene_type:complete